MKRNDVPPEIFDALATMVADRYHRDLFQSKLMLNDVLEKGPKSIHWADVCPVGQEFFQPVIDVIVPIIKQAMAYGSQFSMLRAKEINDTNNSDV